MASESLTLEPGQQHLASLIAPIAAALLVNAKEPPKTQFDRAMIANEAFDMATDIMKVVLFRTSSQEEVQKAQALSVDPREIKGISYEDDEGHWHVPVRHEKGQLIIDRCPLCDQQHVHGGDGSPNFYGHRLAQCLNTNTGDVYFLYPDPRQ